MTETQRADSLYQKVLAYSALGDHRTGTGIDVATIDWFVSELQGLGARAERAPFGFERYDCRWEVTLDGEKVPSIPLFYEGLGHVDTDNPITATCAVVDGSEVPEFDPVAREARAKGATGAVIATSTHLGLLCAVNRMPRMGSGLPTICVAGRLGERLASSRVRMRLEARLVASQSCNVVATLGEGRPEQRVLLTTPLSGWFRCAGERGTGIAICLEVARVLAQTCPVTVLGTSGHELGELGMRHHVTDSRVAEKALFHFGANVASGESNGIAPPVQRTRGLHPCAWVTDERREDIAEALAPLGVSMRLPGDAEARGFQGWPGESAYLAPLGKPLVSIAGHSPLDHSPEDVPELATNSHLLEKSFSVALAAARILASV